MNIRLDNGLWIVNEEYAIYDDSENVFEVYNFNSEENEITDWDYLTRGTLDQCLYWTYNS